MKISKKVLEKRVVKFSGLGSSPGSIAFQGTQGVSAQSSVQVAGDKDEGPRSGESPRANAARPTDTACSVAVLSALWSRTEDPRREVREQHRGRR